METNKIGGIKMKVISFHLKGKMAHFRKFYSNSSALSYFIPPRTTICGIVAGLLGRNRDEYYEEFSIKNCNIAVASCSSIKKAIQKMNFLMIKSNNDLNGFQEHHSQTPMELIIPQNIRNDYLDYKIWIHHRDEKVMNEIMELITGIDIGCYRTKGISVALGSAFNLGWIDGIEILEGEVVNKVKEEIFSSAIPLEKVKDINTEKMLEGEYRIIKEEISLEFDDYRRITENGLKDIVVNLNNNFIPASVSSFVRLDNNENIVWLE